MYIDTSALVKLFLPEREAAVLAEALDGASGTTSIVSIIETQRAIRRSRLGAGVGAWVDEVLDRFAIVQLDSQVVSLASRLPPPILRSLDAIHLGTALSLAPAVDGFVTYDRRLARAASEAGLRVLSPA